MSNRALKIAIVLSVVLTPPAALFAQEGKEGGARHAGSAGTGGIRRGPENAGGLNNATVDRSGSGNPAAPPSINLDSVPEAPVGHRQPRADQVPSENNLMNPNDPINRENAALDRMINGICRGC